MDSAVRSTNMGKMRTKTVISAGYSAGYERLRFCARSVTRCQPVRAHCVEDSRRFTKGTIFSMAQTPDGYLWLSTEFGLVRFDGVQAIPWQPPAGEQLPSNYIQDLLVARDGTLWIPR